MYAGYMTCCPLVSYGEYADWTERLLHYALRYERGQRNNKSRRLSHNILQYIFSKLQIKHCECSSSTSFFPLSSYSFIIQLLIYFHVFLASLAQQRLYLHSRSKSQLHTISLSLHVSRYRYLQGFRDAFGGPQQLIHRMISMEKEEKNLTVTARNGHRCITNTDCLDLPSWTFARTVSSELISFCFYFSLSDVR